LPLEDARKQPRAQIINAIGYLKGTEMKATKLIVAAGLALATAGAFAETGVKTYQIDNVANVYGRQGVPAVRIAGEVQSTPAGVAEAGRGIAKPNGKTLVTTRDTDVNLSGRS
jgi:hypothetical protein